MTTSTPAFPAATILGYPRIGADRELKFALEDFWKDSSTDLPGVARSLRNSRTGTIKALGLEGTGAVPEDFSYYDQVLDILLTAGAVPERFAKEGEVLKDNVETPESPAALEAQFTIARGEGDRAALEMTKWFDSNYHYLVPEIGPETRIEWTGSPRIGAIEALGEEARPVLVGPVTFLALSKPAESAPEGYDPLERLDDLLGVYATYLEKLAAAGAKWVQLDEPALVTDRHRTDQDRARLVELAEKAYAKLATDSAPRLAVALTYGHAFDAVDALARTNVGAVIIDTVRGKEPGEAELARWKDALAGRTLGVGVVSGRNIWRNPLDDSLAQLRRIKEGLGDDVQVSVTTSTSLFHVPIDATRETSLDPELVSWLAFADQKIQEVVTLATGLREGDAAIGGQLEEYRAAAESRRKNPGVRVDAVRQRTGSVSEADRTRGEYEARREAQAEALGLPVLPTTTIGSFPQTKEIRRTRAKFRRGELAEQDYIDAMRQEIKDTIERQEKIGLDVLVHGEPERNDMVQYFAEHFDGFAATEHGWVQSYGSRCTRPSILWGDVTRPAPVTVEWSAYAQSLTDHPVKGMLTGPVTIMAWSFVRDDVAPKEVADQLGLALREEISDLEEAGIPIIQVDEPAIRELLPLREEDREQYLSWAVGAFRLATSGAADKTSIHTHLCYSDFATIVDAVDRLGADVTSIEASRSRFKVLPALASHGYQRGLGPGVWDIHSARVPSEEEIEGLLDIAVRELDPRQVWVNPDCGLKTRAWEETTPSAEHLVSAAKKVREKLS
ncbi:5-methyltetrahydropteroyltriglutamate--homocysteine S-methyltransferase [Corynebacterium otitidis]